MTDDTLWQLFADTGEPMSWLMLRASEKNREKPTDINSNENDPESHAGITG